MAIGQLNQRFAGMRMSIRSYGMGGTLPPGYAWVTRNGEQVTFTGTFKGVSYVNEPVYARSS